MKCPLGRNGFVDACNSRLTRMDMAESIPEPMATNGTLSVEPCAAMEYS